jgi:hypothetical protein
MSFSLSPRSYDNVVSLPAGLLSTHPRPIIPLFSDLDKPTKSHLQPQCIIRDCSFAEKNADAPPSPQKKKYKVSNNPKPSAMPKPKHAPEVPNNPRAKKEGIALLDDASKEGGGNGGADGKGARAGNNGRPDQPYLHLATKEQLMAALKKILDVERDAEEEHVGDNGKDKNGDDGGNSNYEYELHSKGVSSCIWSSSRTRQQTNFFADYGNNDNSNSSNKGDSNNSDDDKDASLPTTTTTPQMTTSITMGMAT